MIKNIQYLRFIAAFLVILAHANFQMYGIPAQLTNMGGFGVDIFFIVSGFIMPYIIFGGMYTENTQAKISAIEFLWRRITRIWPIYFLTIMTILAISAAVVTGVIENPTPGLAYFFNGSKIDGRWLLETLTFTHWERAPILGIGWTLQVEFMFYVAIAVILSLRVKTLEGLEAGLLIFFFASFLLSTFSPIANSFANAMILEFMLGVFLYRIVSKGVLLPKYVAILIIIATIPLVLMIDKNAAIRGLGFLYRPIAWGIPAFFLTWAALSIERITPSIKGVELLGDASYSLYLTHGFFAPVFIFMWERSGLTEHTTWWVYLIAYVIACQGLAIATHLYIEKPLNNIIRLKTQVKSKCVTA